ncbi:hypothetical protein V6N13_045436 [Hibiscus sabdariffa]
MLWTIMSCLSIMLGYGCFHHVMHVPVHQCSVPFQEGFIIREGSLGSVVYQSLDTSVANYKLTKIPSGRDSSTVIGVPNAETTSNGYLCLLNGWLRKFLPNFICHLPCYWTSVKVQLA